MLSTALSTRLKEKWRHSKNIFFPIRQILTADSQRVSIVCALTRLTKTQNVWFRVVIEFTSLSYAKEEEFTA